MKTRFANKDSATNGSDVQPQSGSSDLAAARAALHINSATTRFANKDSATSGSDVQPRSGSSDLAAARAALCSSGKNDRLMHPNLFIIGAMKAGTSSLHEYLHQHPQIFMSRMKEPQYFAPHSTRWNQQWGQGNPYPEPGMEWYLRLFEDAGPVRYAGESSVSYSARPWVVGCEKRIHQFNPEARIIYLMRDPIERTISHYWYFVKDGREDRDLLTALRQKEEYISRSNYLLQLKPYLQQFGRDQVYTLTTEELRDSPTNTLQRLFYWLGVAPDFAVDVTRRFNVSANEVVQTRRHRVFVDTTLKHWRWKRLEPRIPDVVMRVLKRLTYRRVDRRSVDVDQAIDHLRPILLPMTKQLSVELARDFREWTTLFASSAMQTETS